MIVDNYKDLMLICLMSVNRVLCYFEKGRDKYKAPEVELKLFFFDCYTVTVEPRHFSRLHSSIPPSPLLHLWLLVGRVHPQHLLSSTPSSSELIARLLTFASIRIVRNLSSMPRMTSSDL